MKLFSPGALWFLWFIPILILMYILKQRFEEREVSSLYLWNQVLMDTEATSPFQRLKRNILFFLQLLILLLCIFALTNPFVWWKNNNYENIVMIIDTSGSMSSIGEKEIKLEEAKKKAKDVINSLSSGSKMTLITSGKDSRVEISGTTDKKEFLNKLKAIEQTNSAGNIDDGYSLVKAICKQYESYRVIYFSDRAVDLKDLNGEIVYMGPQRNNVSLDYIAEAKGNNGLKVMIRVTNHSSENTNAELCLYGEEKLIALKNQDINAGETKTLYFDNVSERNKYIHGEITQKDGLDEDNKIYSIVKQKDAKRILLSSDKNVFLEKALSTLKDVELYKTLPGEKINDEFDLYIYDGEAQGELPKKGNILFINPKQNTAVFKVGGELEGGKAAVVDHATTKYMSNSDFVISKIKDIETPYWASTLLKVGDKSVSFVGEQKGQRIGVLGFDLHNTDFPLTPEFPIFVNNLISYLIDRDTMTNTQYNCGDSIGISALPEAEKIFITDPDKKKIELSSKYPIKPFEKSYIPGIYDITQKIGKNQVSKIVAVNFPVSESGIDKGAIENNKTRSSVSSKGGINLKNSLLILVLLFLIGEWIVYIKS
jgi:hypothetical protein